MLSTTFPPPISDPRRQQEQKTRDAFYDGEWEEQLKSDVLKALGTDRAEVIGVLDMSCCLGPQMCQELAVCYLREPVVTIGGKEAWITRAGAPVSAALLWTMLAEFQARVLWLQEYVMRIEPVPGGGLRFRQVQPWLVEGEEDERNPGQFAVYREWVLRDLGQGEVWTRDIISISDRENPSFVVQDEGGADITEQVFKSSMSGEAFPFRFADGAPFVPAELYHRHPDGALWHYLRGRESVSATRMAAVLWTFFVHSFTDSSWQQRALIDGKVVGVKAVQESGLRYARPDPTLILQIQSDEGKQAQLGQWSIGADPQVLLSGIEGYTAQVATREGVSPAELQRLSGDPKSGYAISLTNDGKRQAQRRFGPQFRVRDEALLGKAAAVWNRANPGAEPYAEIGYQVSYQSIPMSPDEERALRDQVDWELEKGWITTAQALARTRGISESEAKQIIQANQTTTNAGGNAGGAQA